MRLAPNAGLDLKAKKGATSWFEVEPPLYRNHTNTTWAPIVKTTHVLSARNIFTVFLWETSPSNWSQHHGFICWWSVLINHTHSCASTAMRNIAFIPRGPTNLARPAGLLNVKFWNAAQPSSNTMWCYFMSIHGHVSQNFDGNISFFGFVHHTIYRVTWPIHFNLKCFVARAVELFFFTTH